MKFGGRTQFGGRGKFGGDPLGLDVGYVCDRMLGALSRFKRVGATGFVKTLARLTAPLDDAGTWGQIMQLGAPAFLVHYGGTTFDKIYVNMSGNISEGEDTFSVVCIANSFRGRMDRTEGNGRSRYEPGLDHMAKWAVYYVGNELARTEGRLQRARPSSIQYVAYGELHFVAIVTFLATSFADVRDDPGTVKLERLGICHNPLNKRELFQQDNETPNTNDPTSPAIGYAEVNE